MPNLRPSFVSASARFLHPQSLTPSALLTRSGVMPMAESPADTMSPKPRRCGDSHAQTPTCGRD